MSDNRTTDEPDVLRVVIDALNRVDLEGRERILRYVSDFYGLDLSNGRRQAGNQQSIIVNTSTDDRQPTFGDRATISAKDFLREKQPKTDIERVACLAYYLAHYHDTPHFKTIEISKLNMECAQPKFSNPTQSVKNAIAGGLIVPAGKGMRQISAVGERYVDALPERENAKEVLDRRRSWRSRKKSAHTKKARKASK